ncbi:MAG: hypothetical protein GQ542_10590 [Desulforhopalus sp.]|nr:hypothetical protein [Desulforhopalus sp.]
MFGVLRINTVTGEVKREKDNSRHSLLGGRTLSSHLVSEEIPADCDPFGKRNKLFFCNGALSGTIVSSSDRVSIGSKSPLTGGIKESNARRNRWRENVTAGTPHHCPGRRTCKGFRMEDSCYWQG